MRKSGKTSPSINLPALWSGWMGQLIRFGIIGALNTGLSYGLYTLGIYMGWYAPISWAIGYICGMALSLCLNTRWTFRQKEGLRGRQVFTFIMVNLVSLAASTGMVALLAERLGVNEQLAGVAAIPVSMGINFMGNRLFVYRKRLYGDTP